MYHIHQNLKSVDVKYGSLYHFPTKSFVPIFTSSTEDTILKSIYVSSPKFRLAWNKTFSNDEKSLNVEFVGDSNKFIERLKDFCVKTIKKKMTNEHEIDLNQIKLYTNEAHTLRFYNVNLSEISTYDENGNQISINDIVRDDALKILFHLNGIAFKGAKAQFEMKLIQIMKLNPYSQVNKTMTLLTVPKPICNPSVPPPPCPPPCPPRIPSKKTVTNPMSQTKTARSNLSMISKEDLLKAMANLKKRG